MALEDTTFYKTFKKYESFIMAIQALLIILLLLLIWSYTYNEYQLKKEINKNCGWGEEDYYCYCEKSQAMRVKNLIENDKINGDFLGIYDTMDSRNS